MASSCFAVAASAPSSSSVSTALATATAMLQAHYRTERKLADALYGAVWLCEDLRHTLPPSQSQSPVAASSAACTRAKTAALVAVKQVSLRRARQTLLHNCCMDNPWDERRIAAKLMRLGGHDNILQFQHEFMAGGSWFMVMEYCDGGDLLDLLQAEPDSRFNEAHALALFAQIAQGVRFLHANGIAHRDLSLENVLLRDGVCKLSDFGLSTETDRVCAERVGKAYYMAPEVVACQPYDPAAADMWSLGIMLFILLTGSPLLPSAAADEHDLEILETFGVREILRDWGLDAELSTSTIDLLAGLLHVRPTKRFTIDDLLQQPAMQLAH